MRCANCLHENRPTANFCDNCGSTLEKTCAHCGTVNRPAANFCDHCGTAFSIRQSSPTPQPAAPGRIPTEFARKLAAARDRRTMVGERRVVTMLFCDVVGSTAAAERLDPEEWTEIINGAFEHMIAPVYRYEGTLARLMGDAILAFFGAPIAHEDDPQRAILAGLDIIREITPYWQKIKERWGIEANVRVGINTGLVVVGAVGSDLKMEYSALGDAINLAARMEQTAAPGTVQVSEHTYRLTTPVFDWEPLGELPLKGKEEPVRTYRPLRRRSDPGRLRGIEGLHTPLVGRGTEMNALLERLRALETGRGSVVFVIGEAGLGKSRLVREAGQSWQAEIPERGRPPAWIEKRVSSYDTAQAYNLIRRVLRTLSGIEETAPPDEVRNRFTSWTARLDLPEGVREEFHEVAGRLLIEDGQQPTSQGADQDGFQARLFETMGQLLLHQYAHSRGVIFIDDLHWADSASLDLLQHLASLTEKAALLFIYTARPEWDTPAREFMNRLTAALPHRTRNISLSPLSEADEETLLQRLLPGTPLPQQLKRIVRTKADGNPFYIEEIVRECIESGLVRQVDGGWIVAGDLDEGIVPDSVEALLAARIDRLNPPAKQVLQIASVLGRSFSYRPLARVSGLGEALEPALEELLRSQMLEETARLPEREYLFRQALTQETAYRSILHRRRREYHRLAGEAIEDLFPDSQASLLAFHFEEAGETAQAVRYHRKAGDNAFALYASVEAAEHFGRAIALASKDPAFDREEIKTLYQRKGRAHELTSHFNKAMETYAEMERWGAEMKDREIVLTAVVSQAVLRATPTDLYDAETGAPLLERALRIAREVGDAEAEAKALWARMILLRLSGRTAEAAQSGLQGLEIAEAHDLTERIAYLYHDLGYVYAETGRLTESSDAFRRSGVLWQQLGNLPLLADGLVGDILNLMMRGEFEQAIANADRAYVISLKTHNIWGRAFSKMYLGTVYRELGRYAEALEAAESSIRDGREAGFAFPKPLCTMQRFYIYDDLGAYESAQQFAAELWELGSENQVSDVRNLALITRLSVLLQRGELKKAEDFFRQQDVQAAANEKLLFVFSGNEVINLYLQTNRAEKALERCLEKQALADRLGLKVVYPDLNLTQARILRQMGRPAEARTALLEALEHSRAIGKNRVTWQILAELADLIESAGGTAGRPPAAESPASLRAEAHQILEDILNNIPESLQPTFLARPDVRAVWPAG